MKARTQNILALVVSCLVALIVGIHSYDDVTIYGADLLDMWSYGRLILLVPIILSPIQFILILKMFQSKRVEQKKSKVPIYLLFCIFIVIAPALVISLLNRLELDSVDIPKQSLDSHGLQTIQELEMANDEFPFLVRFHWQADKIRVVFKSSSGHPQIVRDALAAKLPASHLLAPLRRD